MFVAIFFVSVGALMDIGQIPKLYSCCCYIDIYYSINEV